MAYRIRDWDKHFENAASRKLKRLDWVAVPNKMDGSGYMKLVDHPNGAAHLGAWYAAIEIASRQKIRGTLPDVGGICQCLGKISQLPGRLFEEVLPRLVEIGWVEQYQQHSQSATTLGESADNLPLSWEKSGATGNGMEGNGMEGPATAAAPSVSQSEYPLTIAEIRKHDPAVDDFFVLRLVQQTTQALLSNSKFPQERLNDAITDKVFAAVCRESYATANGRPHGTGLLLSRVPAIFVTWGIEAKNGNYIRDYIGGTK